MMKDEKRYSEAVKLYRSCLKKVKNEVAHFNMILSYERESMPRIEFLDKYLHFLEVHRFSFLRDSVLNKLEHIKQRYDIPKLNSPLFSRWFYQMVKNGRAHRFFNDTYMEIETTGVFEIINYLNKIGRYGDALKLINEQLAKSNAEHSLYKYGWKKSQTLYKMGKIKESADYLITLSKKLSNARKDRIQFFAALNYFEVGESILSANIFEEIVYYNKKSKYFLLSLYKLGLLYMFEGKSSFTFKLWSNFLFTTKIKPGRYHSGISVYNSIRELTLLMDNLNNTCLFGANYIEKSNLEFEDGDIIDYYDFLHHHMLQQNTVKKKVVSQKFTNEQAMKWNNNREIVDNSVRFEIVKLIDTLPAYAKEIEPIAMVSLFAKYNIKAGVAFYTEYLSKIGSNYQKKRKRRYAVYNGGGKYSRHTVRQAYYLFAKKVFEKAYTYIDVPSKRIDYYFSKISKELSPSPFHGDKAPWKVLYPTPYLDEIIRLSKEYQISPALLYSVMRAETFYRDYLVSHVGAIGMMQIMPYTFDKISNQGGIRVKNPFDPYESMKAAAWYLSKLLKRFDGDMILAIAAYNAGPHRSSDWLKRYKSVSNMLFVELIPYRETRNYVKKVLKYFEIYSYLYEDTFYDVGLGDDMHVEENPTVVDF